VKRNRLTATIAALVAACVFLSLPLSAAADGSLLPFNFSRAGATRHLYVIDFGSVVAVLAFPIRNGIPASSPDREITGLNGPIALSVDAAGTVYVLDQQQLKVFAPGASGHAKPVRVIDLPFAAKSNIDTLAVDQRGYTYVGESKYIFAYAPTAHGPAQPVASVLPRGYPAGLAVDASGDLYVLGNTEEQDPNLVYQSWVTVYATPSSHPVKIRQFCTHEFTDKGLDYGLAFDGAGHVLATHPYFIGQTPRGAVHVFNADTNACPIDPVQTIASQNPSMLGPVYLAIAGNLYVYDFQFDGINSGAIFTLQSSGTPQTPLAVLHGPKSMLHGPQGIAVGP